MRKILVGAVLAIAAVLAAPLGAAQGFADETLRFETITLNVGWSSSTNRAELGINAQDMVFEGAAASDLRHCIDGDDECSIDELRQFSHGNQDGTVSAEEVSDIREMVMSLLPLVPMFSSLLNQMKKTFRVDGQNGTSPGVTDVRIDGAPGAVGSTKAIRFSVFVTMSYGGTQSADKHHFWMQRTETHLAIGDAFEVRGGRNWRILEDSIKPVAMQTMFSDGALRGTQDQFESKDPLEFDIQYHKAKSPGWGAIGASLSLLAVAFATWRRKV